MAFVKTPAYVAWAHMKERCRNSRCRDYPNYGGRGIIVCERWLKFENFLADMGERPGPGYSLDRKNNDGNYSKSNCRWATRRQQNTNQRQRKDCLIYCSQPVQHWAKLWGTTTRRAAARIRYYKLVGRTH